MAIFNSYVKLPESNFHFKRGNQHGLRRTRRLNHDLDLRIFLGVQNLQKNLYRFPLFYVVKFPSCQNKKSPSKQIHCITVTIWLFSIAMENHNFQ